MAIIFNQPVKHERREFFPGVALEMGSLAEQYFINCGWASHTTEAPVATYTDVEIDLEARIAETGKLVIENANG